MEKKLNCLAVSDLHGSKSRYEKLFELIRREKPSAVFVAGDICGGYYRSIAGESLSDFINVYLKNNLLQLKQELETDYPSIFLILGNDDPRLLEPALRSLEKSELLYYMHNRRIIWKQFYVSGYSCIPPTPFQMKDWEKYDVSRYVDVGAIPPDGGFRTIPVSELEIKWGTIKKDLENLYLAHHLQNDICLFHSPPYKTSLDRAALDGKMVDYAPLDVHLGSIAIKDFITKHQPLLTLHGHVHESTRLTAKWQDKIGKTLLFNCAHDGKELAVVRFDPQQPQNAERSLL